MFCGRIAIGRLPDVEGGDEDNNGDEVLAAAVPHGADLWSRGRGNMEMWKVARLDFAWEGSHKKYSRKEERSRRVES